MKVLQIITSLRSGGAEKLIVDTCIKYNEQGIDVDVLLLDGEPSPFYESIKNHLDINIFSLGTNHNIYNPFLSFKLKSYLKKYDVVHVHLFPALYWVAIANMLSSKKNKIILTEHNTTNRRRKIWLFKTIDRFIYKQFKEIITISDAVDKSLRLHLGKGFSNFKKIYNGINLDIIEQAKPYEKKELGFKNTDKLILQVASFTPQKDQKTVIRAMTLLPDHCKLILVGKGPLEEDCKKLVNQLNLTGRVEFFGVRSDVPSLLKSVDIVVLSSYYEGLSLSSVEGLSSGKPFIASDAPGLNEVVKDAGILFEIEDDKKLSDIVNELLINSNYSQEVVKLCLKRSQKFSIDFMVENYINLYKKM